MARRDNAPIGDTCPMINEVIDACNDVDWTVSNRYTLKSVTEIMEKIRTANATLREWGNELCEQTSDLESEIDDLKSDLKEKESEIEYLNDQIKELQKQLDNG